MLIKSVSCLRLSSSRMLVRFATWTLRERTSSQHWALGGFGGAILFLGFWAHVSAKSSTVTTKATMLKFTFAIFYIKVLDFQKISLRVFDCFRCSKAVSPCQRSSLEISVELELLFDQRLTQALSDVLCVALLCLNILNIFCVHVGPPPLSWCAPLTVLTLSNLQGGGPLPIPPPLASPLILLSLIPQSFCPRFSSLFFRWWRFLGSSESFASAWKSSGNKQRLLSELIAFPLVRLWKLNPWILYIIKKFLAIEKKV